MRYCEIDALKLTHKCHRAQEKSKKLSLFIYIHKQKNQQILMQNFLFQDLAMILNSYRYMHMLRNVISSFE
jgi:hypothetical protein